jgi:cytochrome bd-type quinol oxidase subunit 2
MDKSNKEVISAMAKRSDIYLGASIILSSNLWFTFDNIFTTFAHFAMLVVIVYATYNLVVTHYNIYKYLEQTEADYQNGIQKFIINIVLYILSIVISMFFVNNKEASEYTISLWLFIPLLISLPLFITQGKIAKNNNHE